MDNVDRFIYPLPFAPYVKDIMDISIYLSPFAPSVQKYCGYVDIKYIFFSSIGALEMQMLVCLSVGQSLFTISGAESGQSLFGT